MGEEERGGRPISLASSCQLDLSTSSLHPPLHHELLHDSEEPSLDRHYFLFFYIICLSTHHHHSLDYHKESPGPVPRKRTLGPTQ